MNSCYSNLLARLGLAGLLSLVLATGLATSGLAEERLDFNRDIRPILSENCFYCHGQDANKRQGRSAARRARGGDRGGCDRAGRCRGERARSSGFTRTIPTSMMPPPKSNRRLSAEQKKLLERWIAEGAEYETHWAFVAPTRPRRPDGARRGLGSQSDRSLRAREARSGGACRRRPRPIGPRSSGGCRSI